MSTLETPGGGRKPNNGGGIKTQINLPWSKGGSDCDELPQDSIWAVAHHGGGHFSRHCLFVLFRRTDLILAFQHKLLSNPDLNRQIWLVIMALLVCTVGITNAMLMSVAERFREIGTMKCLGL